MAKTNLTYWYHLIAIITVIIWGTTFVSTKVLIHHGLSPVDILFYRFALAYICIWFISPKVLFARSKRDELMFVAAGLCGGSIYFITENTAYLMASLLKAVVDEGTGRRIRFRYHFTNPIGGKTGTTQNHSDGWFIGITPDLAGGVCHGLDRRSVCGVQR